MSQKLKGLAVVISAISLFVLHSQPAPPNDNFDQRQTLPALTNAVWADNTLASAEAGEPFPISCDAARRSLWWTFTSPATGSLWVGASGVSNSVVWSVYRGTNLSGLQLVADTCSLPITIGVQSNDTFQIKVDGAFGRSGTFSLGVNETLGPPNDAFTNSVHLEGTNITYTGNFTAATFETNEPIVSGLFNTIWASWAAPYTGRARFNIASTPQFQAVGLYTGPSVDHLQAVRTVLMGNGLTDFLAVEGTVYHFQLAGGSDNCTLFLQIFPVAPPINDAFANARQVAGTQVNSPPFSEWFSILDATAELGEPAQLNGPPFKSLWWKWTSPVHGKANFWADRSLTTNVVIAAYQGSSVAALTLIGKGTNNDLFNVTGGESYYVSASVPTNAAGDLLLYGSISSQSSTSRAVPGNLLQEPSWEGTAISGAQYWRRSGSVGGVVNQSGGCDGTTWPTLGNGAQVYQDIPTVPGQSHAIRFAMRANTSIVGSGTGDGQVRVLWDGTEVGMGVLPAAETTFWHWPQLTATANNTTSRVAFVNVGRNIELDAFSVVPLTAPPQIITQPSSFSVLNGGTVAFIVGASGSSPLSYQWYFNNSLLNGASNSTLILNPVSTNQAGNYQAVVTSPYGIVTSALATLVIEAPTKPVIYWQPYGDMVGVGGYKNFSVVAAGSLPLYYQWFKDGQILADATNRNLTFSSVDFTNAGVYSVRVQNDAGIVWSLTATLTVTNTINGGGKVNFANKVFTPGNTNIDAPVYDIDGVTKLNGSNFVAQLYGGPALEWMRPVGDISAFKSGFGEGYFYSQSVTLPTVPPGSNAILQVRAWDIAKGASYEEARAMGGRFGKSDLISVQVGGGVLPAASLDGLKSFQLQAGLPQFVSGKIIFQDRQPGGIIVWAHLGQPGFRYLIEKSFQGFEWNPFLIVTNVTDTTTFRDSARSGSSVTFYRSRILD